MPKYLVSIDPEGPASGATRRCYSGDPATEVAKLRDEIDGYVIVHGSGQLVQALIEADLVDELRLMVFPVVLGTGQKLFGDTSDSKKCKVTDYRVVGDGVGLQVYERI